MPDDRQVRCRRGARVEASWINGVVTAVVDDRPGGAWAGARMDAVPGYGCGRLPGSSHWEEAVSIIRVRNYINR